MKDGVGFLCARVLNICVFVFVLKEIARASRLVLDSLQSHSFEDVSLPIQADLTVAAGEVLDGLIDLFSGENLDSVCVFFLIFNHRVLLQFFLGNRSIQRIICSHSHIFFHVQLVLLHVGRISLI